MGSHYYLNDQECPYCQQQLSEVIFAECLEDIGPEGEWMGNYYVCDHCNKKFRIEMKFVFERIE